MSVLLAFACVFLLSPTNEVAAQSCSGRVTCCSDDPWEVCRDINTGQSCIHGQPNCRCELRCSPDIPQDCSFSGGVCGGVYACSYVHSGRCDYTPPQNSPPPSPSSSSAPTSPPGWGACGSCGSCNGPANECITTPEGACVHDPGTCGSPSLPFCRNVTVTPQNVTARPGEEVTVTVSYEGTSYPPGSAQFGGIIFRPLTPGVFQMRGGTWGPYATPPNSYYTNTLSWPYKNFYAYNICCGDAWGWKTYNATIRANSVGLTSYTVGVVRQGGPRIDDISTDAPNSTWNSSNSCIGYGSINVVPPPQPTCTVTATPSALSLTTTLSPQNLTANVSAQNGTVNNVTFTYNSNGGNAVTSPSSDTVAPYTTQVTPITAGGGSVRIGVVMNGAERCSVNAPVNVTAPPPYISVSDGDVVSNGNVNVDLRAGTYLINKTASTEGIGIYRNILNLGSGQLSLRNWKVSSGGIGSSLQYDLLREQVPSGVTVNNLATNSNFNSIRTGGSSDSEGYIWYEANGNTTLTLSGNSVFPAGRKVVVFVNGNLTVAGSGSQTFANVSNSFLMFVVRGDIRINSGIGHANSALTTPNLSAIFYSGDRFITDPGTNRLNVLGTVVALNGLNISRNVATSNPSEYFIFSPELLLNYPPSLGIRRAFWREVQP